jgi:glycosyltransferase involved in cell wall biosynthesis
VLILNGNTPEFSGQKSDQLGLLLHLVREYGAFYAAKHGLKMLLNGLGFKVGKVTSIQDWMQHINRDKAPKKRIILTDLPRDRLIQAYLNADLFVFASNIEYSPLVLFEACAAGLPFLSVPVGNAAEIAEWTGGGLICPSPEDERHYTRVVPEVLARHMEALANDPELLSALGAKGRDACLRRFNWDAIASEYEAMFERLVADIPLVDAVKIPRASATVAPEVRAAEVTTIG